ncbi:MAG: alpha/beta fold hydrolase [Alcanivoracaceae bacterium]|jgi:pimeloyl-ACP methyl ester carboxylesterase|nr:alpha/beta fold hydrolase [Alcanivoracaceae bacterium]
MNRQDLQFQSSGVTCRGWFYRPDGVTGKRPCVVMAHGFGATRSSGIEPFAEAFCQAGYCVFLFDYRHFGDSEGEPRQLLNPGREVEDWLAALAFVRQHDAVDAANVCLWGTSFSGGLVTVAAARDGNVQCIIAQCPMMDGLASVLAVIGYGGLGQGLKLTAHGLRDIGRSLLGMSPHYMASAGRPGDVAAMTAADCWDGYTALLPQDVPNRVAARIAVSLPLFRPVARAAGVRCPALVLVCDKDTVAPARAAVKAAGRMARAEVKHYPVGHFDVYQGEALQQSLTDQLTFLAAHMPVPA